MYIDRPNAKRQFELLEALQAGDTDIACAVLNEQMDYLDEQGHITDALIYVPWFHASMVGLAGSQGRLMEVALRYRVRYQFVGKGETEHYSLTNR